MPSVLHLLDSTQDYQTQTGVAQLSARNPQHRTAAIGRGEEFSNQFIGILNLHRHLRDVDLIHAWGPEALTVAAWGGRGRKIVYSPTSFPTRNDLRWVRSIASVRDVQIVCETDTMRRAFVQRGVPIEQCQLIRPGVDFSKINRRRNDELREKLGFKKDDFVILGVGESTRGANHHMTVLGSTVLAVLEKKYKLLLWGRGPKADIERRFCSLMLNLKHTRIATDILGKSVTFEQLLPAADCALITADAPVPTLPIAVCMAAAMPIVTTVSPTIAELLEDRHNSLMTRKATSRWIARRILDLIEDPQLSWMISDAARTEAYEYFSMTRFVSQMQTLYEQFAAGKKVDVPPVRAGAGSRFAGRV